MVKKITLTRPVPSAASPVVLGRAVLALAGGGSDIETSVMKSRHDIAMSVINNLR